MTKIDDMRHERDRVLKSLDKRLNELSELTHRRIEINEGMMVKQTELEKIQYQLDTIRKEMKDYQKSK